MKQAFIWLALWIGLVSPRVAQAQGTSSRDALALSYLRLEYALRDRPVALEERAAEINRAFDAATMNFFGGKMSEAARAIDSIIATVVPDSASLTRQRAEAGRVLARLPRERRTMSAGGATMAYRLFVPASARAGVPAPLIVALHGAGGDENMFLEAYGAGRLRRLAEERGAILVTPQTADFVKIPDALSRLIDAAATAHPVDRRRVYLIGHSMGAGAAWRTAVAQPSAVAAVACLAALCGSAGAAGDSTRVDAAQLPPLLVVAGALDPLAAPGRVGPEVERARARGVRVEYRTVADYGHTLLVGQQLPGVVDWLLAQGGRT